MPNKSIAELLDVIQKCGKGTIRSSGKMNELEIAEARAKYRFYVDEDGFGYEFIPHNPEQATRVKNCMIQGQSAVSSLRSILNDLDVYILDNEIR